MMRKRRKKVLKCRMIWSLWQRWGCRTEEEKWRGKGEGAGMCTRMMTDTRYAACSCVLGQLPQLLSACILTPLRCALTRPSTCKCSKTDSDSTHRLHWGYHLTEVTEIPSLEHRPIRGCTQFSVCISGLKSKFLEVPFTVSRINSHRCWDSTLKQATTASLHIVSNSQFKDRR